MAPRTPSSSWTPVTPPPSPGPSQTIGTLPLSSRLQSLFGHHPKGTNFGFADGSVRFLKETITPKVLHDLTTRNGGEIIYWDDFEHPTSVSRAFLPDSPLILSGRKPRPTDEKDERAVPRSRREGPPFFQLHSHPCRPGTSLGW